MLSDNRLHCRRGALDACSATLQFGYLPRGPLGLAPTSPSVLRGVRGGVRVYKVIYRVGQHEGFSPSRAPLRGPGGAPYNTRTEGQGNGSNDESSPDPFVSQHKVLGRREPLHLAAVIV